MRRIGPRASAVATIVAAVVLVAGGLVPKAAAATPDPSNVVIVLDFSASILNDGANRTRFAAALTRMADRVDATKADLVAGDATVSLVQFATRAADVAGCTELKLLGSPRAVGEFATCLRAVAGAYSKGLTAAVTKKIGIDTNYVAAMEQAAKHLPAKAIRPAMILFTDGRHDVKGIPVAQVQTTLERLFGTRSPFALLPVGMGLAVADRAALAAGLERLRIIRDMPACVSGTVFEWPQVVFESADQAGIAVAVALQDATCTFTAAEPLPTPTPAPTPAAVREIRLTPGDGHIDVAWAPASASPIPIVDYTVRCRAGEGDWIESTEGVSTLTKATIAGLTNGTEYRCEVAAVAAKSTGPWTPASSAVSPLGRPAAPGKPSVEALNGAVRVSLGPNADQSLSDYHYECSSDGGATWTADSDAAADTTVTAIGGLTNGVDYVCRAFAENPIGTSDASPLSDAVRPCSGPLECGGLFLPVIGGLVAMLVVGVLAALVALLRGRVRGYVVAVVDVVHTANIGSGSRLGIAFVRDTNGRTVTGIVAERGSHADLKIRRLRGERFAVTDRFARHVATDGEAIVVADSKGIRHSLELRAFDTAPASTVASRR